MSTLRATTLQHGSSAVQNIVLDNQGRAIFGPDGPQGRASLYVNAQLNRVGVNNESPTVALDVDGAINATGNTTLGGTLTVTGNVSFNGDIDADGEFFTIGGMQVTSNLTPTTGAGWELFRSSLGFAQMQAYDRSGAALLGARIHAANWRLGEDGESYFLGNFGIGTSSPEEILHVAAASEAVNTRDGVMLQSTSAVAADTGLPIVFTSHIGNIANYGVASIAGRKENATSGNAAGYLQFATGSSAGAISEKMRINSNGDVGIGGSPSSFSTQKSLSLFAGTSTVARLDFYNSDGSTREAEIITYSNVNESLRIAGITNRPITFHTNNTERMVLDEDGSLIVGSTASLTLTGGVESQNSGLVGTSTTVDLQSGVPGFMSRLSGNNDANQIIGYWFNHGGLNAGIASTRQVTNQWGTDLRFYTHKSQVADQHEVYERLRIYPDGGMRHGAMISNTTHGAGEYFSSGGFISIQNLTFNTTAHCFQVKTGTPTTATRMVIRNDGDLENVNNSYGAYSDASMKENIVDANSQWDDIKALRVRNYNFKEETGQSTHRQIGVIAQEIEAISPGLVSDGFVADDDGNPTDETYKTVTYSVLYMKAVKALQEAMERIETLESKVSTLEAQ